MRQALLEEVAARISSLSGGKTLRVAVDGVDGAGKSVFAGELAAELQRTGHRVVHASVDGFHAPRSQRYRRGRFSPEGYYRDSYDYPSLVRVLLDPLGPRGSGLFRRAVFDHVADSPVATPWERAEPDTLLVLDGIFLHRSELRDYWDFSVFLRVGFGVSIPRGAQRGDMSPDPHASANRRYVEGQRLYFREAMPWKHATVVVDNTDLESPSIV